MSLRRKLWPIAAAAPIALAFAALAAIELFYFPGRDSTLHVAALRTKAVALAELTAHSVVPALEFEDEGVLAEFLNGVARDKQVARARACTNDGTSARSVGDNGSPGMACPRVSKTEVVMRDDELLVLTPIASKSHPGSLEITFRTQSIALARQASERVALGIAGGILALGLGVSLWVARMLQRLQALLVENREARARAEAASEAKTAFLANMSHEIRTPMNGVLGVAQLLAKTDLDGRQRRHVETIERSGQLLLGIINDILDFSKVEAGKLELVKAPLLLPELLVDVLDAVAESARAKGLELENELDPSLPACVMGDGLRLRQVLLNLISNAIKFTVEGRVLLRVARAGTSVPVLRFEVVDSGIGIPEGHGASLFEAFTQVDGQTTRRYGGTGLGLAICKRLVELMGGEIGFESQPGRGSTFWCILPLESASPTPGLETDEPRVELARRSEPAAKPERTYARILGVDDNEINRVVLMEMTAELGQALVLVDGGRAAVNQVMNGELFSLILMDCQMPDVDGYTAARQIREWEDRMHAPRTPIIAVTAHALAGEADKVRSAGMDDYLAKPVSLASLRQVLDKWLPRNAA
jgi:signal transduction histidine kinase/ActR/RegA family two-component response regulator